jgi:hypothetical protein
VLPGDSDAIGPGSLPPADERLLEDVTEGADAGDDEDEGVDLRLVVHVVGLRHEEAAVDCEDDDGDDEKRDGVAAASAERPRLRTIRDGTRGAW